MRVHFKIIASAADRRVHIDFRNLEDQPSSRYSFAPEQLGESLCDQLSKVLLRKEEYLTDAYQKREASRKAEQEALPVNRTKRALFKGSKDAMNILKRQLNRRKSNSNSKPVSTSKN